MSACSLKNPAKCSIVSPDDPIIPPKHRVIKDDPTIETLYEKSRNLSTRIESVRREMLLIAPLVNRVIFQELPGKFSSAKEFLVTKIHNYQSCQYPPIGELRQLINTKTRLLHIMISIISSARALLSQIWTYSIPLSHYELVSPTSVTEDHCSQCGTKFHKDDIIAQTPCKHYFHACCLDYYFTSIIEVPSCPVCNCQV